MTCAELRNGAYLPAEIASIDKDLRDLQNPPPIADIRQQADYEEALNELRAMLTRTRAQRVKELKEIRAFIDRIPYKTIRTAIFLHYMEQKSWVQVQMAMMEHDVLYSDLTLKALCSRYLNMEGCDGNEDQ